METVRDFIFLGSKITADGDCSHEIKRHLLLGRKAMTNLNSILKSRDATLLTKIHLVKAMVFPVRQVLMWKLDHKESWAPQNWCFLNCGVGEDSWESLGQQGDQTKSILKKTNPEYSLKGLMLKLKLQHFDHLIERVDSLKKTLILGKTQGRRRREHRRWDGGWHHRLNERVFEQTPEDSEGQGRLACCSPRGHKELDMT